MTWWATVTLGWPLFAIGLWQLIAHLRAAPLGRS